MHNNDKITYKSLAFSKKIAPRILVFCDIKVIMAEDYEQQFEAIEGSYYFRRLEGIMLLIPTENDDRSEGTRQNRRDAESS